MVTSQSSSGSRTPRDTAASGGSGGAGQGLYSELAEIPVYTRAEFVRSPGEPASRVQAGQEPPIVRVTTSVADHLRNTKRTLVKYVTATAQPSATPAQDMADAVASFLSPSGALLAVLREVAGEGGAEKKRFVEIWKGDTLRAAKEVTKLHGAFYTDEMLSSASFSPSENAILYTAEAIAPETTKPAYAKYRFAPTFGEKLADRKQPCVFVMRWTPPPKDSLTPAAAVTTNCTNTKISVAKLEPTNIPDDMHVAFGQAIFHSDDHVFATGYEQTGDGRILGVAGCFNRPSGIWEITLPAYIETRTTTCTCVAEKLTPKERSCRSPRIVRHENKATLVWLSHKLGGPHHACAQLHARDLDTGAERLLVGTVRDPEGKDDFYGLFLDQLPPQPGLVIAGKQYIVTHSVRAFHNAIHLVSFDEKEPSRVVQPDPRAQVYSWTVLNTDGRGRVLCSRSRTDAPNELVLASFKSPPGNFNLHVINKPEVSVTALNALDRLCQTIVPLPNRRHVETIVVDTIEHGEQERIKPCIMMPHGGPHVAATNAFNPTIAALALEGYVISMPNYTGSLGYGQKFVEDLVGHCGILDVKDCFDLAQCLIEKKITKAGPGYQFIYGGSHGGFLGAHLIGQHPNFFSAVALRNPVISAGEMASVTDIPDWCFAEISGSDRTATTALTGDVFEALRRASPIAHVDKITTPVLLLIGEQDQRVPPSQGRNFYHALKGRGKTVDMLWFPGKGHALDNVETMKMSFEAARDWFKKYRR